MSDTELPTPSPYIGPAYTLSTPFQAAPLVARWFQKCLISHPACAPTKEPSLPSRVLFVGSDVQDPYLYEARKERGSYTALSHCLGEPQSRPLMTTRATLPEHKEFIPITMFPPTFRDAMALTRELGFEYIWIDSLCIIQDDKNDWAAESARMAEVYQKAVLVISADGSKDCQQGLFQPVAKRLSPSFKVNPQATTGDFEVYGRSTTLWTRTVHGAINRTDEPLRRRAWALQEWLLPSRIVHFCTGELLWDCNTIQQCECQVVPQLFDRNNGKSRFYKNKSEFDWGKVVAESTKRQLTVATDQLPAISGLAALAKSDAKEDYVGGHWKSDLPLSLLWKTPYGSMGKRHDRYYAPSWSWPSVIGAIEYYEPNENDVAVCEVIELSYALASGNHFGPIENCLLKLKGHLAVLPRHFPGFEHPLRLTKAYHYFCGSINALFSAKVNFWPTHFNFEGRLVEDIGHPASEVRVTEEIGFLIISAETYGTGFDIQDVQGPVVQDTGEGEFSFKRVGFIRMSFTGFTTFSQVLSCLNAPEKEL